jgi:predicted RNA-binding protein with PUA-like domain
VAQKHIAAIKKGDRILGYHTAPEESVHCGLRAARAPHQNPELKDRNLVLDVALVKKLKRTVPLTELRKNPKLRRMKLSNSSALSLSLR